MKRFVTARRPLLGAALAAVLVTAACGSNHTNAELQRAAGYAPAPGSATGADVASPYDAASAPSGEAASLDAPAAADSLGVASAPAGGSAPGSAAGSATGTAAKTPTGAAAVSSKPGAAKAAAGSAGPAGSGAVAGSPSSPTPGVPGAPQAPAGGGSTIVLGSIGSDSGVLGQILRPVLNGAKAWTADVNARGGINGHPVKVVFADDGGDPGRALSLARGMIDQQGVQAFFAERGPGTAQAVNGFLEQRKIPVIGGCGCSVSAAESPMSFMVGYGGNVSHAWGLTMPLLSFSDKRKVSIIYCRESPTCKASRDVIVNQIAKAAGLQIVHEAQVTITAPDYTAEALAAKNSGAEAIIGAMDQFSLPRLAKSAHRQNWYPEITMNWSGHDQSFPDIGGEDVEDHFLIGAGMPHWTSPKLNDFRGAMQKYVPDGVLSSWSEMAWGAGKVIEVIGKNFPANPTSADFLKGLYALNGETLGGLVPPLAYQEGKGSDQSNFCIVPMRIHNKQYVPKDGDNFTCAPGWQPVRK